jgi:hypothetical protein
MWTLLLPRFDVVRQVLEQGLLGGVRTVLADHGERFDPPHRILTALATWTLGPAQEVYATGETTPSGVNGQAAMVLTHGGGARSVLHTTLLTRTPTTAVIAGTAATLTLPGPFFMPGDVVLTSADGGRTVTWAEPEPIGHGALYHSAVEWRCGWRRGTWNPPCARRPTSSPGCGRWTRSAANSGWATTRRAEPRRGQGDDREGRARSLEAARVGGHRLGRRRGPASEWAQEFKALSLSSISAMTRTTTSPVNSPPE